MTRRSSGGAVPIATAGLASGLLTAATVEALTVAVNGADGATVADYRWLYASRAPTTLGEG